MQNNKFVKLEPIWVALFGVTLVVFFWFFAKVLLGSFDYLQLSEQVVPKAVRWSVLESKPDYYQIKTAYTFNFKGKEYAGEFCFKDKEYGNKLLAQEVIKLRLQEPVKIWISKDNPSFASMQRLFPLRDLIRAILAFSVFVYFVWLKLYSKPSALAEGK